MTTIIRLFCEASGMKISSHKSYFSYSCGDQLIIDSFTHLFSFNLKVLESGINYLGFHLKMNAYNKGVWDGLIKKLDGMW